MIVDGQVHGGVAQGIAEALYEEAIYDESGNLMTSSMTKYLRARRRRRSRRWSTDNSQETWSTTNPLGVKGIGEAGTIASPPAVINAVIDALATSGVTDVGKPASPGARVASDPATRREVRHDPRDVRVRARRDRRPCDRAARAPREDAKILAGGHSLLPLMRFRLARPDLLVDIGRVARPLVRPGGRRRRGDRGAHPAPRRGEQRARSRRRARSWRTPPAQIGDPQVRHMGTIGGSVAHGDPASDLPTVLVALDADFVIRSAGGHRAPSTPATSSQGLFTTDLRRTRCSRRSACRRRAAGGPTSSSTGGRRTGRIVGVAAVDERRRARRAHEHGRDADRGGGRRGGAGRRRGPAPPRPRAPTRARRLPSTRSAARSTGGSSRRCWCAGRSKRRWGSASVERLEPGGEVAQLRAAASRSGSRAARRRSPATARHDLDHVVDVALRVGAPRDREPHQVHRGRVPRCRRAAART